MLFSSSMRAASIAIAAAVVCTGTAVRGATPEEVTSSITKGLGWLAAQQQSDGRWQFMPGWYYGEGDTATTGLVLTKLTDRAYELGLDPFDADPLSPTHFEYANQVIAGYDYLGSRFYSDGFSVSAGSTYQNGIGAMAFVSSRKPDRIITAGPLAGMTYLDAVSGLAAWLVANQAQVVGDCDEGGWGYAEHTYQWADQSNSGYATLGLGLAAAAPPRGFGVPIPADVRARLAAYIQNSQVADSLDPYYGGSVYNPCWGWPRWVNTLKTGNLLYELALTGETTDSPRVQTAVDFIGRYWDALAHPESGDLGLGWKASYQAMFTMMKGLESLSIKQVPIGGVPQDWFDLVSTFLVNAQAADGSFPYLPPYLGEGEESPNLRAVWALLTLERVVPIVEFGIPDQCVQLGTPFAPIDADTYVTGGTPPFTWSWTGNATFDVAIDSADVITVTAPSQTLASETITFRVTDAHGWTTQDPATFTVDILPVLLAIADQVAPFTPIALDDYLVGAPPERVTFSASPTLCLVVSIDPATHVATVSNPGGCTQAELVTFTASGTSCGQPVTAATSARFTPNRPPDCAGAVASQQCLWSPNNQLVPIEVGVTDPDGDPVSVLITAITSDEATATQAGAGGPNLAPDAAGVGNSFAQVRAERSGLLDGRVYRILFEASDGKGGACKGSVAVGVPHGQAQPPACNAIDSGQLFDATTVN